ncbi:MAG: hypothetical protein ACYDAQ_17580 [Mycobacteriales bacterium]
MSGSVRDREALPWAGPTRPYDLVKEFVVATVVVALLVVLLAALFGSPDEKALTLQGWARSAPADFVATTVAELDGTSPTATYGPPYNRAARGQALGPLHLSSLVGGVREPVDTARDFVITPLRAVLDDPALQAALAAWTSAPRAQQVGWATAYGEALAMAPGGDPAQVPAGGFGPVPVLAASELALADSGALDGALTRASGFYALDYTKPLLFLNDGRYFASVASAQHLAGNQWGMMNETGSYPGQAWLWLYTFFYQVPPFSHSGNADALVWVVMALASLLLVCVPFLPGVRTLPRHLGVHRLIWRDWYRRSG